jgi:hypothetical protein
MGDRPSCGRGDDGLSDGIRCGRRGDRRGCHRRIGGAHRGDTGDVSADLPTLAHHPVAVVAAGAKSILDLPRTLEALETLGVPVVGFGTRDFPAFYARSSGLVLTSAHSGQRTLPGCVLFAGVGLEAAGRRPGRLSLS